MAATNFAVPGNNVSTTLSVAKSLATLPQTITLSSVPSTLPTLSAGQYWRVTICQVAFAYSPTATPSNYTIYKADTLSGSTIVLESVLEGTTDRAYAAGDIVEIRVTAGTLSDIHTAVNALENAGGSGMAIGNTVTSGTSGSVLFVDSSTHLAQNNSHFTWDNTNLILSVSGTSGNASLYVTNNGTTTGSGCAYFQRSNSAAHNIFQLGSTYALNTTNPLYSFGVQGGQTSFTINSWDGAAAKTYFTFASPANNSVVTLGVAQNVTIDSSGYLSILTGSGAPGGSPATGGLYLDTTNFKLYGRCGSTWKSVTLA